ncbi:MAG TPA: ATP-binding cassette domain-containing protein [Roseiflexaceae bacterium]|nr:ATP-binding cassette domain-containing protein [Roseiflexaceae bacterium]
MNAIAIDNLSKTYTTNRKAPGLLGAVKSLFHRETIPVHAVRDLSLQIEQGEMVGFLGPNGAGKTTTLKMVCGLIYPSSGDVRVLGHTPARREAAFLRRIALVMGQKSMLWWDIPASETLLLHRDMYRIPEAQFRRTVDDLAGMLDVADLLHIPVRKLSLGERMKMELLAALVHRPEVLFLDEPTIGLDVVAQQRVRDFLRELNRAFGTTILLTSHYMDDIEALCKRVLVIDHGLLRFDGMLSALVAEAAPHKLLSAVFAAPPDIAALGAQFGELGVAYGDDERQVRLRVPRDSAADVAAGLLRAGRIVDLSIEDVPVEEIIRDLFGSHAAGVSA